MRAPAWNALRNGLVAVTVAMPFYSAFCTPLGVLALECLMANLLAVVALHRSWSMFKDAGHAGFPSSVKEPLGQESSGITTFDEVDDH